MAEIFTAMQHQQLRVPGTYCDGHKLTLYVEALSVKSHRRYDSKLLVTR